MSSDDNYSEAHMTPTARNNCTCGVCVTSSNFGPVTYFGSHYCCGRTLYAVFHGIVFFKKTLVEQSCLTVV